MAKDSPATLLMASQIKARKDLRAQWKQDAGDLLDAHELAFSAIANAIERFGGRRFEQQAQSVEGRMSLTAQFLQGIEICEVAISEGLYSQAAALLKQQMETIEAVHEFEIGTRRDGRTPRIGGRLEGWGPIYGDMNAIAHVSRHDLAQQLVRFERADISGPSVLPQYNFEISKLLYGIHVYLIIEAARINENLFNTLYGEGLSDDERDWLAMALQLLVQEGAVIPARE